jgi:hypothetical protein
VTLDGWQERLDLHMSHPPSDVSSGFVFNSGPGPVPI